MKKQITLTVKGNHIPFSFTKTVNGYGTKFTAIFTINKWKEPTMSIKNIEINKDKPAEGWDNLEDLDNFFYSIQNLRSEK
jgi:hypothetical protein